MEYNSNLISQNVKRLREQRRLSSSELARQAQISKAYLSQLEGGRFTSPSAEVLFKIAGALGVTIADLTQEVTIRKNDDIPLPPSLKEAIMIYPELKGHEVMLANIKMRGKFPKDPNDWLTLFTMIKNTIDRKNG